MRTITDKNRRLDLEAVELLRKIEGLGIPVVLVTGNVIRRTEAASIFIGTSGPMIAENGGIIIEKKTKEPIYLYDIEKGQIKEAFEHLQSVIPVRKMKRSDLRKTEIAIYRILILRLYGVF
jgi:hydroxymethylpyrimidine pyrophosphatase-like HAD family hydrolase